MTRPTVSTVRQMLDADVPVIHVPEMRAVSDYPAHYFIIKHWLIDPMEVRKWCMEHGVRAFMRRFKDQHIIMIHEDAEAVFFKLRWCGL